MPACRASPDIEISSWVGPWAEWLPVRRQSRDCSEAAVAGADSLRDLPRIWTCPLSTFTGSFSPLLGSQYNTRGPGEDSQMELSWPTATGRVWSPRLAPTRFPIRSCRVCQAGRAASDNASKEVTLALSSSGRARATLAPPGKPEHSAILKIGQVNKFRGVSCPEIWGCRN